MNALVNFAAFQAGWFACVLGAANGVPWIGTLVVAAAVAWHLSRAARPAREGALLVAALLIGLAWDSAMVAAGVLTYETGMLAAGFAPYWIVALWPLFATTLNVSLRWLRARAWWAAAFGAVGGPLAYAGGAGLGAVGIPDMAPAMVVLGAGWALITPALTAIARHFDGYAGGGVAPLRATDAARA